MDLYNKLELKIKAHIVNVAQLSRDSVRPLKGFLRMAVQAALMWSMCVECQDESAAPHTHIHTHTYMWAEHIQANLLQLTTLSFSLLHFPLVCFILSISLVCLLPLIRCGLRPIWTLSGQSLFSQAGAGRTWRWALLHNGHVAVNVPTSYYPLPLGAAGRICPLLPIFHVCAVCHLCPPGIVCMIIQDVTGCCWHVKPSHAKSSGDLKVWLCWSFWV